MLIAFEDHPIAEKSCSPLQEKELSDADLEEEAFQRIFGAECESGCKVISINDTKGL